MPGVFSKQYNFSVQIRGLVWALCIVCSVYFFLFFNSVQNRFRIMDRFLDNPEVKELLKAVSNKRFKIGEDQIKNDISDFNGVKDWGHFQAKFAKYAYEEWSPKEGDVIICTYPKSGTHWIREIVTRLLYTDEQYKFMNRYDSLDAGPVERFRLFDILDFPIVLCTHQPDFNVNIDRYGELGAKIIYVYRNPKDVVVSYFHFHKNFPKGLVDDDHFNMDWDKTVSTFLDGTMAGSVRSGDTYFDHVLGYYNHRHKYHVLFMSYESMKKDTKAAIRKVSHFLGLKKSDEDINFVLEASSMKSMKKSQEESPFLKKLNMIRKGEVGDWKNYFTVAQSKAVDELARKKMKVNDMEFFSVKSNI